MSLDLKTIIGAMNDVALASGLFDSANGHEPKSKPGNGLTIATWSQTIRPVPRGNSLVATTVRVEMMQRIYTSMLSEPQDAIDPALTDAVDYMLKTYHAGFTLVGTVREIDLLGEFGEPLSARAGYLNMDGKLYRIYDLTVPTIINDLWIQGA